jgi:hypothetical protein
LEIPEDSHIEVSELRKRGFFSPLLPLYTPK